MLIKESITLPPRFAGWDSICSPAKKNQRGRPSGGLLILFNDKFFTPEVLFKAENWIFINVRSKFNYTFVIGLIYFQINIDIVDKLNTLECYINSLMLELDPNTPILLGGDFNAKVGDLNQLHSSLFNYSEHTYPDRLTSDASLNSNGRSLVPFFEAIGFCLLNGRSSEDNPAKFTLHGVHSDNFMMDSPTTNPGFKVTGTSVVDLAWCNLNNIEAIDNFYVNQCASGSDHFPIVVKLKNVNFTDNSSPCYYEEKKTIKWEESLRNKICFIRRVLL